jgi:hypothetical protein
MTRVDCSRGGLVIRCVAMLILSAAIIASLLSHRKMRQGRQARVYSKALVEENEKPSRRQDRVPRR